jgi:predicted transcriptional regulator
MQTREYSRTITARLAPEVAERLERLAAEHERSISGELRVAVRAHLARQQPRVHVPDNEKEAA